MAAKYENVHSRVQNTPTLHSTLRVLKLQRQQGSGESRAQGGESPSCFSKRRIICWMSRKAITN